MKEIYLISPATIKSLTNIDENVHEKFLVSAIRESQNVALQTCIGTSLLNKLKNLIEIGEIDLPANAKYKELLDNYITYFLMYQTISKLIPIIGFKLDNIGVFTTSDEHVQQVSFKNVFEMQEYYTQQASFYLKRLEDFLKSNKADYPELEDCFGMQPELNSSEQYSCLFLGGKRGRKL